MHVAEILCNANIEVYRLFEGTIKKIHCSEVSVSGRPTFKLAFHADSHYSSLIDNVSKPTEDDHTISENSFDPAPQIQMLAVAAKTAQDLLK